MSEWWRHFFAALGGRPILEDDEQPEHRCNAMVLWSGLPVETDKQKAAELLAAVGVPTFPQNDDVSPDS